MIRHILKDGTTRKDMDGYLVSREACPEAYKVMEGMNDNSRQKNGRETARPEISHQGEKSQVRQHEATAHDLR